ncbi:hypothetical protein SSS_01760 [Sarcoptes scabiei]|uniref:Ribonuclease P n=1 Tax=Sarcoptes scabiei TaxID=52283 RepID=A0A132A415_SARSC|nr:hypothetical protein SSS_01760 [Sarcoptes scabiei]KPM05365.1 ribonuclease P/MRP protein subunit POP5-like protein [Sarcoptes scabiei]UXI20866.1 hypothetical protein NH340_JMT06809 [Sarcoptes scabiei]
MPPIKRRYILFKLKRFDHKNDCKFTEIDILKTVREKISCLFGDVGYSKVFFNFHLKKYDSITCTGVFAIKRDCYRLILTTLPLIETIASNNVRIDILKVTGTLRGCLRALQGYHGKMIANYKKLIRERNKNEEKTLLTRDQIDDGVQSVVDHLKAIKN